MKTYVSSGRKGTGPIRRIPQLTSIEPIKMAVFGAIRRSQRRPHIGPVVAQANPSIINTKPKTAGDK